MGSLLPGWDENAPGVAPRELQDFKEEDDEDRLGYFARLSMSRKMKGEMGTSAESTEPIPIGRRSMPLSRDSAGFSSSLGSRSFSKESPGFGSFKVPPQLQRMTSLPVTHGEGGDVFGMPKTPKVGHSGGSGGSIGRLRSPKSLDAYKMTRDDNRRNYQWWELLQPSPDNLGLQGDRPA
eukprot:gene2544-2847_t